MTPILNETSSVATGYSNNIPYTLLYQKILVIAVSLFFYRWWRTLVNDGEDHERIQR